VLVKLSVSETINEKSEKNKMFVFNVIPAPDRGRGQAPAGIHSGIVKNWIPAFAGMTKQER